MPALAPDLWIVSPVLRAGFCSKAGGALVFLGRAGSPSVIDADDHGRCVQQSIYGDPDGTHWPQVAGEWCFNAIQAGEYTSRLTPKLTIVDHGPSTISFSSQGMHWVTGAPLPVTFTCKASVVGPVLSLQFDGVYRGEHAHAARDHEEPAIFVKSPYRTLVNGIGGVLQRSNPGWPNEYGTTDGFLAMVNAKNYGLGVRTKANRYTTYSYALQSPMGCAYVAPLNRFSLIKGARWSYGVRLAVGTLVELAGWLA